MKLRAFSNEKGFPRGRGETVAPSPRRPISIAWRKKKVKGLATASRSSRYPMVSSPAIHSQFRWILQRRRLALLSLILVSLTSCWIALPSFAESPSTKDCAPSLDKLARELLQRAQAHELRNVAVGNFKVNGGPQGLGEWLGEELLTHLAAAPDSPSMVERQRLTKVLEEQKLGTTGLFDTETVASVGLLLGADAMVLGSLTVRLKALEVKARVVSVATSQIYASARANLLPSCVPPHLLDGQPAKKTRRPSSAPMASWEGGPLRVEVNSVNRTFDRKEVTVKMRLVNTTEETIQVGVKRESFGRFSSSFKDDQSAHLAVGDTRGSGIASVVKKSPPSDYTRLGPGAMAVSMTFRANKGILIQGEEFLLNVTFVLLEEGKRAEYVAGLAGLRLAE